MRINKRQCKPSSELRADDILEIAYPRRILTVRVTSADETALKRKAEAYVVVEERPAEKEERPW